jgi:Tfp pilus assembly protein PilO
MKHNWSLVVVILFMLAAGAAERFSAYYVHSLEAKDKALVRQADEMRIRTDGAAAETKKYQEIERLAVRVQDQIRWEPDSTRVMRSFGDIAAGLGVKLVETRTVAVSSENKLVAGGAYQRMRIESRLVGSFWSLIQFVDNIERSAQPMVVESLSMTADRDKSGTGELRMTVSALYPAEPSPGSGATTGDVK